MRIENKKFAGAIAMAGLAALLSGCRVGPKYVALKTPPPPAYKEASADAYKGAPQGTWQPAKPEDAMLKGKWWEVFQEPELNGLEEQLDINNNNIAQYFQNFMAARAVVREARSQFYPTLAVVPSYSRTHSPGTLSGAGLSTGVGTSTGTGTGTSTGTGATTTTLRTSA
jgi:outer membrane protein TolC